MPSIVVDASEMPGIIQKDHDRRLKAAEDAIRRTLRVYGKAIIQEVIGGTNPLPVDRGSYRRNWHVADIPHGGVIYNDTPYASVVEDGRRPGSAPPFKMILAWVKRKKILYGPLQKGMSWDTAQKAFAWAIWQHIRTHGMKGRKVMARANARIAPVIRDAVEVAVRSVA